MKKLIACLLMMPMMAQAGFKTGNDIYKDLLDTGSTVSSMYALGFIVGVHDSFEGATICAGPNVTAGQIRDVVKKYLAERPEMRDISAAVLVVLALGTAFPCAQKKGKQS
jgi:hypothetical protein